MAIGGMGSIGSLGQSNYSSSNLFETSSSFGGASTSSASGGSGSSGGTGYAGLVAKLIGAGVQAYGTIQKGYDAKTAYGLNSAISRANAATDKFETDFQIDRMRKSKRKFRGTQVAGYAKAGVKSEGSPLDVMIDSAAEAETDILITKYKSNVRQIEYEKEARISDIYKRSATKKAYAQGVGNLLSSFSSYGSK